MIKASYYNAKDQRHHIVIAIDDDEAMRLVRNKPMLFDGKQVSIPTLEFVVSYKHRNGDCHSLPPNGRRRLLIGLSRLDLDRRDVPYRLTKSIVFPKLEGQRSAIDIFRCETHTAFWAIASKYVIPTTRIVGDLPPLADN